MLHKRWHQQRNTINLVERARWDRCADPRFKVVHITGERVLDVKASTGDITWSQVSESLMLKTVQVTSRDHRWVSPWCWSQYRWHHLITGERVLDVEASTRAITSTDEWTVWQWIWCRQVCFVQHTFLWTVLCWSQLSIVKDLNWAHHWHYRNTRFQQQQQQQRKRNRNQ